MKSNSTLVALKTRVPVIAILLLVAMTAFAQAPVYRFQSPSLISGSDRNVGAKYRFSNVTTGVDALVTILSMSSGISLQNIDRTTDGYAEAFQPEYRINSGRTGYIDFRIDFVNHGTSTLLAQPMVDASGLDIDGSTSGTRTLMEMNTIDMGGGVCTFNTASSHITVSKTGTAYTAQNITGYLYGALVDTAASEVMFTVSAPNVSSFTYRVGASSTLTSNSTRYASLYFKKFLYPDNSILAGPALQSFSGVAANQQTQLQWMLYADNDAVSVTLEKGTSPRSFVSVAEFWVNMEGNSQRDFRYTDRESAEVVYYRLAIRHQDGKLQYSNVLSFRQQAGAQQQLHVFPTQVTDALTMQYTSVKPQTGRFEVIDYSGRVVMSQSVKLLAGQNNIRIQNLDGLPAGLYISALRLPESVSSARISKR
jgi:hypothetical protein